MPWWSLVEAQAYALLLWISSPQFEHCFDLLRLGALSARLLLGNAGVFR